MTLKAVALSALSPAKGNPRRRIDKNAIIGLAESIKTDGVLQNLVVEKSAHGKFTVISGSRRYLALRLLKRQRVIDDNYKVPVKVRALSTEESLRVATMENVQRVNLDPIDEADAFARMLQHGATVEDLCAKTGLSAQTIRRRLALSDLCAPVKDAIQKGELPLGIAEALTLGTEDQQRTVLKELRAGALFDRDEIREMLCAEKPTVAIAIFPVENYTGSLTRDLFAEDETTYFDDVEQFFSLQKEAVEAMAYTLRKKSAWVEVLNSYSAPWWQYREAKKREPGGVVINLKPNGHVEVKKRLVRHEVREEVAQATKEMPDAPKERPIVSGGLVRYVGVHKSMTVQACLLQQPRKAREVMAVSLLLGMIKHPRVRIDCHPCVTEWDEAEKKPKALAIVRSELSQLLANFGLQVDGQGKLSPKGGEEDPSASLYTIAKALPDEELERLSTVLIVLSFGQQTLDGLDTKPSLFNSIASDLQIAMRDWWTPDEDFLTLLRKEQLETVAIESDASLVMSRLKNYSKKELVNALSKYFERSGEKNARDGQDSRRATWLPGAMGFPARSAISDSTSD